MSALGYKVGFTNGTEQIDLVDLEIEGHIPSWLTGVLYRSGPATFDIPSSSSTDKVVHIQHWFDGLTMNHRFEIYTAPDGSKRVSYRSRKAAGDMEKQIAEEGKYTGTSFGQKSEREGVFQKFATTFREIRAEPAGPKTVTSRNIGVTLTPDMPGWPQDLIPADYEDPHYLVAKTDNSMLQLLDPVTLEPLRLGSYQDLFPSLGGQLAAAHSCRDRDTGDYYNFVLEFGAKPTYKVFRIAKDNTLSILAEITDAPPAYIHSFAMTGRYVILCVWASHITYGGLSVAYYRNLAQSIDMKADPKVPSVFYVIDRHNGGVVAKYKTPPFYCFHQLNAYDDPSTGDIIIDMAIYPDASIIKKLELETLRTDALALGAEAKRFRLRSPTTANLKNIEDAVVDFSLSTELGIELPTVRPSVYNKPYRFAYGVHKKDLTVPGMNDALIKVDMTSAAAHKICWRPNMNPSEPIFVSRPGSTEEDDGVLLTVALDGATGKSGVVVVDAKDMTILGEAKMKTHYPFGFHGVFVGGKTGQFVNYSRPIEFTFDPGYIVYSNLNKNWDADPPIMGADLYIPGGEQEYYLLYRQLKSLVRRRQMPFTEAHILRANSKALVITTLLATTTTCSMLKLVREALSSLWPGGHAKEDRHGKNRSADIGRHPHYPGHGAVTQGSGMPVPPNAVVGETHAV